MLARFAREGDFDVFLLAGRYTLLDQEALAELLPLCVERGIAIIIGGVMNSGILADPRPGGRFNYQPRPPAIVDRAQRLAAVCARHGVPLQGGRAPVPARPPGRGVGRRRRALASSTSTSTRRCSRSRSRPACGTTSAPRASCAPKRRRRRDRGRP